LETLIEGAKRRRDEFKKVETHAFITEEEAKAIKEQCEIAFARVAPQLEEAASHIKQISKQDMSELKTMFKPPKAVKLLFRAVCHFLKVAPIRVKRKEGIGYKDSWWKTVQSKEVLGDLRLPERLLNFNKNEISEHTMAEVRKVMRDPEFTASHIKRSSKAAMGIYLWVKAISEYHAVFQEYEPRRVAMEQSDR